MGAHGTNRCATAAASKTRYDVGKEGQAQVCYIVTCHAAAQKRERQRTKVTNKVCRAEPTPACPNRTEPPPEGPHPHPSPVSQDPTGEKEEDPGTGTKEAGKEKDRDTHQGGGREKVHAREEGGPGESRGKGKERRNHERNRR